MNTANLALIAILLLILIAATFLLFERWTKQRNRELMFQLKIDNNKAMAPLRISACERLVVMLERITPASIVMRNKMATNSGMMQLEIIRAVREEFEHNVSLQLYVSVSTWEKIKTAKDDTLEIVKAAYTRVKPDAPSVELSREIFKLESATGNSSIRQAIAAVRFEIDNHFPG